MQNIRPESFSIDFINKIYQIQSKLVSWIQLFKTKYLTKCSGWHTVKNSIPPCPNLVEEIMQQKYQTYQFFCRILSLQCKCILNLSPLTLRNSENMLRNSGSCEENVQDSSQKIGRWRLLIGQVIKSSQNGIEIRL